jgi:glycine/serine hydroxymethyltransferase
MGPEQMREIASMIGRVLGAIDDDAIAADVREQADRLCAKFTPYPDA